MRAALLQRFPTFGTQGILTSAGMTALLARQVLRRWGSREDPGSTLLQDMMIQHVYLDVLHCNLPDSHCTFFV